MSINWPKNGINHTPSYQTSGIPYVTSSADDEVSSSAALELTFPYVTKFFQVTNTDDAHGLRVGFTENGVNSNPTANYFILNAQSSSMTLDIRCTRLYFRGEGGPASFSVVAGLTPIEHTALSGSTAITGSSTIYSAGVG